MAKSRAGVGQELLAGPMEILCLMRLGKVSQARGQLEKLPKGEDTDLVKEILNAGDMIRSLSNDGYAF
jgi:hypothetical protein